MTMLNNLLARASIPEVLPTDQAAVAINRAPQTLRRWACYECGPVRPVRINGRLAWRVADLQALINGTPPNSGEPSAISSASNRVAAETTTLSSQVQSGSTK